MAENRIMLDTSVLIDFFRKTNKAGSKLAALSKAGYEFCISVITEYEIWTGVTPAHEAYWLDILKEIPSLAFDSKTVQMAVRINKNLKQNRKQIAIADLFIAATALTHNLPVATLNKQHFDRVEHLVIVD
jgi:tRNA(fMet)-specific endonuclease VapC